MYVKGSGSTNLVTSDKNCAFAWFGAVVGSCCKTRGNQDSSCDVHTDDMTRKIETTAEVESSGKSPTSPDNKYPTSSYPSFSKSSRMADAKTGNLGEWVGVFDRTLSCVNVRRMRSKEANIISECTTVRAAIAARNA